MKSKFEPTHQAILKHDMLGDICVTWNEEALLVTSILVGYTLDGVKLVDSNMFKMRFEQLHNYITRFGADDVEMFPIECLDFSWASDFYRKVYRTLFREVPRGSVITYAELAELAGSPRAARAVGTAMRNNRFLIGVPCHRVVGANYLGRFSAGIGIKEILLKIEGVWENLKY